MLDHHDWAIYIYIYIYIYIIYTSNFHTIPTIIHLNQNYKESELLLILEVVKTNQLRPFIKKLNIFSFHFEPHFGTCSIIFSLFNW
jgi:hypothetical protein